MAKFHKNPLDFKTYCFIFQNTDKAFNKWKLLPTKTNLKKLESCSKRFIYEHNKLKKEKNE